MRKPKESLGEDFDSLIMKEKDIVPFKTALGKYFKEKDWSKKISQ